MNSWSDHAEKAEQLIHYRHRNWGGGIDAFGAAK
jgi:hypothetical protein